MASDHQRILRLERQVLELAERIGELGRRINPPPARAPAADDTPAAPELTPADRRRLEQADKEAERARNEETQGAQPGEGGEA